jgi:hypothetical protein
MILIGGKFEVSSKFSFTLCNHFPVRKAERISELGRCMILVGREFVISSSFGLILRNTSPFCKAESII